MNVQTIEALLDVLKNQGGTVLFRSAEKEDILRDVETELNLHLPDEVHDFYAKYEYLQIGAREIEWVRNLISRSKRIYNRRPDIPHHYLPVQSDGMGGYYFIICSKGEIPKPRRFGQVDYNPAGVSGFFEPYASSFLEFIASQIKEESERVKLERQ